MAESSIRIALPFLPASTAPGSSCSLCLFLQARKEDARISVSRSSGRRRAVSRRGMKLTSSDDHLSGWSILQDDDNFSPLRERLGRELICKAHNAAAPATDTEKQGWEIRQNEADNGGSSSSWQWTLNWNEITPSIVVGSCPRTPDDVERIAEGSGINAILNVQSDLCFDALKIPFESIKRRASERSVYLERVPIRDFDHGDQALMLPEAVRMLNMLVARGMKVYVHCTAGINRASLTVVGYLTFIQGMELDDAVNLVKSSRTIAHPYIDCWVEARRRLLDGRSEELTAISRQIYESRRDKGLNGNPKSDWEAAQKQAVTTIFNRWLKIDLGVIETELDLLDRQYAAALRKVKTEFERDMAQAERNHISFDYSQYVAAAAAVASPGTKTTEAAAAAAESDQAEDEQEDEADDSAALECDVITRQCVSQNEVDLMFQKPLSWYLSRKLTLEREAS